MPSLSHQDGVIVSYFDWHESNHLVNRSIIGLDVRVVGNAGQQQQVSDEPVRYRYAT